MYQGTATTRHTARSRAGRQVVNAPTWIGSSARMARGLSLLVGLLHAEVGRADECTVPSTHASIANAVADTACDTVRLEAATYTEDIELTRALILSGPDGGGAVVRGAIQVSDGGGGLLRDLAVETPCGAEAMSVFGLADLSLDGVELRTITDCALIFQSGFESGSASDWADDTAAAGEDT